MKTYLMVSGTVFVLLALLPFFIMYEHWGESGSNASFVLIHAAIGICSAALGIWAFRLARRVAGAAAGMP